MVLIPTASERVDSYSATFFLLLEFMNTRPPFHLHHHHYHHRHPPPTKLTLPYTSAPALSLDCVFYSAWSINLWSVTRVSVCHSGVHHSGNREKPNQKKKGCFDVILRWNSRPKWLRPCFSDVFFLVFFFIYFICFVLNKPQWKTKRHNHPCLLFMEAASYLRLLSRFMFSPFFAFIFLSCCSVYIWSGWVCFHTAVMQQISPRAHSPRTMNPNTSILYWSLCLRQHYFLSVFFLKASHQHMAFSSQSTTFHFWA